MLLDILNTLKGFVEIEVTGFSVARFVNMAVHREIYIWDVVYYPDGVRMKVSVKGFKMLRECGKKTKCKIKIIKKHGLPFAAFRYRKRKFLAFGIIFFVCTLYFLSSFLWVINISGNETITSDELLNAVKESGVEVGKLKYFINQENAKTSIKDSFENISWVTVSVKGTQAYIEIIESLEKVVLTDKESPCDIVAKKDAVITNIITTSGTPIVKQKDVVRKGDILVSNELLIKEDEFGVHKSNVHSDAEVYGKLYYEINFSLSSAYSEKKYTDNIRKKYIFKIFGKEFKIPSKKINYVNFDKTTNYTQLKLSEDYPLPIFILKENYKEFELSEKERDFEQLKMQAAKIVNRRIIEEFNIEVDVTDKNIEYEKTSEGIDVKSIITTIERIDEKIAVKIENEDVKEKILNENE